MDHTLGLRESYLPFYSLTQDSSACPSVSESSSFVPASAQLDGSVDFFLDSFHYDTHISSMAPHGSTDFPLVFDDTCFLPVGDSSMLPDDSFDSFMQTTF